MASGLIAWAGLLLRWGHVMAGIAWIGTPFFFILLGPSGGPGNVGVVPGLYMYSKAFTDGKFGYACALGMIMFLLILLLTIIYQRYVKVDK